MALTDSQRGMVQRFLDIGTDETVFTNDELDDLYDSTDFGNSNIKSTVYWGWVILSGSAAKLYAYSVAQTKVSKDQVFDHVKQMVEFWAEESRTNSNQLAIVGMNSIPTRWKDQPADEDTCRNGQWVRVYRNGQWIRVWQ